MTTMIKGEKADYSASLFEVKGAGIYFKKSGTFVDVFIKICKKVK